MSLFGYLVQLLLLPKKVAESNELFLAAMRPARACTPRHAITGTGRYAQLHLEPPHASARPLRRAQL
ncbi:hypothetical protein FRC12_000548 [Ceratobasidium sp. 428]|nr:hypothetical protein FRC12_000548 [Ceratobasidium sp. 428]